ncbi:hypothetical protein [Coxiella burnetii]|uniref:Lipoprotein n=1 Tax=Coxiella burnetii (strain RSA 493 / Nine Mile phase I) TaxID=227377 RepID=B5QSF4_COXBU|nr:hypothetical protein [Coxiella burnetii]YP_002333027.1 hypothetical protein CBU_1749a [Coxiella burnetii RSA 493]ACI15318.1 hypothetical protein CBU_1749a [Coxiella burnetii RSA 493]ACJ19568.1 hypothetical protein CbuK_0257 [Coxiella burnetii CbuK_Q154]MCF2094302.1 hypothetical protein [Coxiella burnetii]MCF2096319.1 hypothetical protein [Coxiella burnetii]MCF2098347.1 hypothetical protein [Coxiella burnetii]
MLLGKIMLLLSQVVFGCHINHLTMDNQKRELLCQQEKNALLKLNGAPAQEKRQRGAGRLQKEKRLNAEKQRNANQRVQEFAHRIKNPN